MSHKVSNVNFKFKTKYEELPYLYTNVYLQCIYSDTKQLLAIGEECLYGGLVGPYF